MAEKKTDGPTLEIIKTEINCWICDKCQHLSFDESPHSKEVRQPTCNAPQIIEQYRIGQAIVFGQKRNCKNVITPTWCPLQ